MDARKDDTPLLRVIVQALIRQVEAIAVRGGGNARAMLDELFDKLTVAMEAADDLKSFAAGYRKGERGAASDLDDALSDFAPFMKFMSTADKSSSGKFPSADANTFLQSATDDCMKIIRQRDVTPMELPPISDLEMPAATAEEIIWYKWTFLVVLYAIEFGLLYGTMVTVWNLIRTLGGTSFKDPARIGTEISGAIAVAMTLPGFKRVLEHILERTQRAVTFEGDVDTGKKHVEMIVTSILGGEAIHMGIKAGNAIAGDDSNKIKYAMFLGNFMAFFAVGLINATGQMVIGRKLVVRPEGGPFPGNFYEAMKTFGNHCTDMDILTYERLVHFLNWGCYEVYGGGLQHLAKGAAGKEVALAGSLWIFVLGFKMSFYWMGKLQARRAGEGR